MSTDQATELAIVTRDAEATEWVEVDVLASVDPLGDAVQLGLRAVRSSVTTWLAAAWAPGQVWVAGQPVRVRALVGPDGGDVTLEAGARYDVRVQVTDVPERPTFTAYVLEGI